MKFWTILFIFILGLGLGLSAQVFVPQAFTPYLPKILQDQTEVVEGRVVRKQLEPDRLLLTVSTPQGALLATFEEQITEIDLLVEEGDTVTLGGLTGYEPFVNDPRVKGVMKPDHFTPPQERGVAPLEGERPIGPSTESYFD